MHPSPERRRRLASRGQRRVCQKTVECIDPRRRSSEAAILACSSSPFSFSLVATAASVTVGFSSSAPQLWRRFPGLLRSPLGVCRSITVLLHRLSVRVRNVEGGGSPPLHARSFSRPGPPLACHPSHCFVASILETSPRRRNKRHGRDTSRITGRDGQAPIRPQF